MKYTITEAIKLARQHINVSYHGGYYVSAPYYGLRAYMTDPSKRAGRACTQTFPYKQTLTHCRWERIAEAVSLVCPDADVNDIYYQLSEGGVIYGDPGGDWRKVVRDIVRKHKAA